MDIEASNLEQIESRLGLTRRATRYYQENGLTEDVADQLCVLAGRHPGEIWEEWWSIPLLTDEELDYMEATKFCLACEVRHPRSEFHAKADAYDGLNPRCKWAVNMQGRQARLSEKNERRAEACGATIVEDLELFEDDYRQRPAA